MTDKYLSLFKHFDEMQCYDYITHPEMDQILSSSEETAKHKELLSNLMDSLVAMLADPSNHIDTSEDDYTPESLQKLFSSMRAAADGLN